MKSTDAWACAEEGTLRRALGVSWRRRRVDDAPAASGACLVDSVRSGTRSHFTHCGARQFSTRGKGSRFTAAGVAARIGGVCARRVACADSH
eukprot:695430-Prymnesium_polylepis.2